MIVSLRRNRFECNSEHFLSSFSLEDSWSCLHRRATQEACRKAPGQRQVPARRSSVSEMHRCRSNRLPLRVPLAWLPSRELVATRKGTMLGLSFTARTLSLGIVRACRSFVCSHRPRSDSHVAFLRARTIPRLSAFDVEFDACVAFASYAPPGRHSKSSLSCITPAAIDARLRSDCHHRRRQSRPCLLRPLLRRRRLGHRLHHRHRRHRNSHR